MGNCLKSRKRDDVLEQDNSQVSFNQRLLKTTNYEPFEPPKNKIETPQVHINIEKEKHEAMKEEKAHLESDEENKIYSPVVDQKEQRKLEQKPLIQLNEKEDKKAENVEGTKENEQESDKKQISETIKLKNEEKNTVLPENKESPPKNLLDAESIQQKFSGVNLLANDIFSSQPGADSQSKEELKLKVPVYIPDSNELIQIFEHVTPTKIESLDLIGQQETIKSPEKSHFTVFGKKTEERIVQELLQSPIIKKELVKDYKEEPTVLEEKTEIPVLETNELEQPRIANENSEEKEVIIEKQEILEEEATEIVQEKEEPIIEANIEEPVQEVVEFKEEKVDIPQETEKKEEIYVQKNEEEIIEEQPKIEEVQEEKVVFQKEIEEVQEEKVVLKENEEVQEEKVVLQKEEVEKLESIEEKIVENVEIVIPEIQKENEEKIEENNIGELIVPSLGISEPVPASQQEVVIQPEENENKTEKEEEKPEIKAEEANDLKNDEESSAEEKEKPKETKEEQEQQEIKPEDEESMPVEKVEEETNIEFIWKHGGENVFVCGEFTKWNERLRLNKNAEHPNEFSLQCKLNPGSYQYKFIVDEKWVSEETLPRKSDGMGAFNNVVEIK